VVARRDLPVKEGDGKEGRPQGEQAEEELVP
jgi:hypothetical protein